MFRDGVATSGTERFSQVVIAKLKDGIRELTHVPVFVRSAALAGHDYIHERLTIANKNRLALSHIVKKLVWNCRIGVLRYIMWNQTDVRSFDYRRYMLVVDESSKNDVSFNSKLADQQLQCMPCGTFTNDHQKNIFQLWHNQLQGLEDGVKPSSFLKPSDIKEL